MNPLMKSNWGCGKPNLRKDKKEHVLTYARYLMRETQKLFAPYEKNEFELEEIIIDLDSKQQECFKNNNSHNYKLGQPVRYKPGSSRGFVVMEKNMHGEITCPPQISDLQKPTMDEIFLLALMEYCNMVEIWYGSLEISFD